MFTIARSRCVSALAALLSSTAAAWAQCPSWDPYFAQQGADQAVLSIAAFDDGSGVALYAVGPFTSVGGVPALYAARWNGTTWTAVGAGLSGGYCWDLQVHDDGSGPALYGAFSGASRWNGTSWSSVGNLLGVVRDFLVYDDGTGSALYACGGTPIGGGHYDGFVARWNGTTWTTLLPRFDRPVECMGVFDAGSGPTLYAAGQFYHAGSTDTPTMARWNGTSWSAVPNVPQTGFVTMVEFDDGSGPALYVAGGSVHRFNGSTWSTIADSVTPGASMLLVFDDGFGSALYAAAGGLTRWNGTGWTSVGTANGQTYALAAFDDGSDGTPDLYVAGAFSSVGGQASSNIAELHGCTAAVPYCAGDGSGSACPCGNFGAPRHGCAHSVSSDGALLSAQGSAVLARDTLTLIGSSMPNGGVIYFQDGAFSGYGVPFADGLWCMYPPVMRLATKLNVGGRSRYPETGDAPISIKGAVTAAGFRSYQALYRDAPAYCTPATSNLTQALRVIWSP